MNIGLQNLSQQNMLRAYMKSVAIYPRCLGVSVSPQVCAESVCVKHGLQQCDCPGDSMMEKCHTCCQQPGNHEPTEECVYTAGPRKSSCVNIYWGHPHVLLFCLYDITHNTCHPICCHGQVERTTSGVCFEALLHSLTDMWPNVIIWSANTIHPEPQNYFDFLSTVKSSTTELYSIVVSPFVLKQIECLLTFFFLSMAEEPDTCASTTSSVLSRYFQKKELPLVGGAPCYGNQGYCDKFHKCRLLDADGPIARLKNSFLHLDDFDDLGEWMKVVKIML